MQHIIVHTTTTILVGCIALGIFWHDSNLDKATSYALARPAEAQIDAGSSHHKAEGPTAHQHTGEPRSFQYTVQLRI